MGQIGIAVLTFIKHKVLTNRPGHRDKQCIYSYRCFECSLLYVYYNSPFRDKGSIYFWLKSKNNYNYYNIDVVFAKNVTAARLQTGFWEYSQTLFILLLLTVDSFSPFFSLIFPELSIMSNNVINPYLSPRLKGRVREKWKGFIRLILNLILYRMLIMLRSFIGSFKFNLIICDLKGKMRPTIFRENSLYVYFKMKLSNIFFLQSSLKYLKLNLISGIPASLPGYSRVSGTLYLL